MADTAAHLVDRVLPQAPVPQWVLSLPHSRSSRLAFDAELCGAVTFVKRFGDALNLNFHFHSLILDGVYLHADDGSAQFRALPPPTNAGVERFAASIARRLVRLLERRGLLAENPDETDPLARDGSVLGELYAASIRHRAATGPRAGRRVALHANVAVPARDRKRRERLCRADPATACASGPLPRRACTRCGRPRRDLL